MTASLILAALAAAAGGVVTSRVAAARAAGAEAAHPPAGTFVDVGGTRVHVHVAGEGPDVVLIHGAFGSFRDFTFDLGRTDPALDRAFAGTAESPAEQAALLAAAARQLGAERPVVVGHSFGGIVAMAWALDHDPAAVVLLAGVALPWPGELGWIYEVNGTALGGGLVAPLLSAWAPEPRLRASVAATFAPQPMPAGYADHIGPYMPLRLPAFRANARQVNTLRPHVVEMERRYPALRLPIEIVHGDADRTVPIAIHSRPLSERVASANLTVLPGIGHMPHHAAPEATVAAIDRAAARAGLR